MGLSAQKKQHALAVAATLAGARQIGQSAGLLGGTEEEAMVCQQAIRLVHTMDLVDELVDEDPSLLTDRLEQARYNLLKRVDEIIRERASDRRQREYEEARKKLTETRTQELKEASDLSPEEIDERVQELVESELAVRFPDVSGDGS